MYVSQAFALQLSLKRLDQAWKENLINMVNSGFVQNVSNVLNAQCITVYCYNIVIKNLSSSELPAISDQSEVCGN